MGFRLLSVDAADDEGSEADDFFSLLSVTVLTSALSSNGNSVMMDPVVAFAVVVTGVTVKVSGIEVIERGMASDETVTGTAVTGIRPAVVVVVPLLSVVSTDPLVLDAGRTRTVLAPREPDFPSVELLLSDRLRLAPSLEKVETIGRDEVEKMHC